MERRIHMGKLAELGHERLLAELPVVEIVGCAGLAAQGPQELELEPVQRASMGIAGTPAQFQADFGLGLAYLDARSNFQQDDVSGNIEVAAESFSEKLKLVQNLEIE